MGTLSTRNDSAYEVRLAPRAEAQLRELSPVIAAVVQARLLRLATRTNEAVEKARSRDPVQGHLLGRTFRALYEVDHDDRRVTVLDVAPRG